MDTEKIINEWFYRLPNGYANYPYSDKELAVLHEVLDANGLSLDSPQEIRQTKVQRLIEQDVKADVNDVASLLFSADLDQESLLEIQELIIQVGFKKTILPYLASKGITGNAYQIGNDAVRIVFNLISAMPDIDNVLKYFSSPKDLTWNEETGRGDIQTASGLPKDAILSLMTIQPGADIGGNATGPGEIALALLFGNVTNKTDGGGDLDINGQTLEVKGKDARLGAQSRGKRKLESTFLGFLLENAVASGRITEEDYEEFINDSDHNNISIAIRDAYELLVTDKESERTFLEAIQKGIAAIFFENKEVTKKYFDDTSDFKNVEQVKKQLTKINLEAYMDKINTDMILFHNFRKSQTRPSNDLRFAIVNKDDIDDVVEAGTINLGSFKTEGSFFWDNTNPSVKLKL